MRITLVLAAFSLTTLLQAADPGLVNLVMPNATVLAGINVQKAKTTAFGQFILQQMPAGSELDQFVTATGFDPRQDITEVLMAGTGGAGPSAGHHDVMSTGLILVRGTFNTSQIEAAAGKDGKHISQNYNGAQLITGTKAGDMGAIAFLPAGIAMAGDLANVKAAIDRRNSNNAIDPVLAAKVAGFIAADAWSVSISPVSSFGSGDGAPNPLSGALKGIQQASGSVTFSSPVQISAEAVAQTDQDATSLSDVIRFVASMMQGDKKSLPFGALLQSLNVTTDHSTVRITASIPEDQIEQAIKDAAQSKPSHMAHKPAAHV